MKPTPNNYLKCPFFTSWYDYWEDKYDQSGFSKTSGRCDFIKDGQCSKEVRPCACDKCNGEGWCWKEEVDENRECDYIELVIVDNNQYTCDKCDGEGFFSDKEVEE
jgi:hypothetical protein